MIPELIDQLERLERLRERDETAPIVCINIPDGKGNVLTVMLQMVHTQGKCKSPTHALLMLIRAFRDGAIQSLGGRHRPNSETFTHKGSHDLDKRISCIELDTNQ